MTRRQVLRLIAAAGTTWACRSRPELPVFPVGGDFRLTTHDGMPFESTSLRGRVVLLFFGYTFCPDVCPTTLGKIATVRRGLGDEAARVAVVFVTVDPARDSPAVLREYLAHFSAKVIGLTGTDAQIAQVAQQFGAGYEVGEPRPDGTYLVSHSTRLYGIDPDGRTRLLFRYEAAADEILAGVRDMLAGVVAGAAGGAGATA
jgi:protein SCO1/2